MLVNRDVLKVCEKCPLYEKSRRFVLPEGNRDSSLVIVGMNGGENEFILGRPFVGHSGRYLARYLGPLVNARTFEEFLNLRQNTFYITNACICDVLNPVSRALPYCRARLRTELSQQPRLVLALGTMPLNYLLQDDTLSVTTARGYLIRKDNLAIFSTYHPAHVLRQPEATFVAERDFEKFYRILRGEYKEPETAVFIVDNLWLLEKLTETIENLPEEEVMAVDLETSSLDPFEGNILCLSLSFQDYVGYVIPMDDPIVYDYVRRILKSKVRKGGHNFKFDMKFLKRYGFGVKNVYFDTQLAQHVINENVPRDLTTLTSYYLDYPFYVYHIEKWKRRIKSYAEIPQRILFEYAGHDAIVTRLIWKKVEPEISKNYAYLFWQVELPVQVALVDVELRGIKVDRKRINEITQEVAHEIQVLENQIRQVAREDINLRSSRQVATLLYGKLKLKPSVKTAAGQPSTSSKALSDLLEKLDPKSAEFSVVQNLLRLRARHKLMTTYLSGGKGGIWRYVKKGDRVHPVFKVTGTVTGRLSAEDPPIQTIPKSRVRTIFVAEENYKLIEADLGSAELYATAFYAQAKELLEALYSGIDIHSMIATKIFKKKVGKKDIERKIAKTVVYGVIYGRTEYSLAESFHMSLTEARRIIDSLFAVYPELADFIRRTVDRAKRERRLTNIFGRTRIFPPGPFLRSWERQAVNFLPQSTIADFTNQTLALLSVRFVEENLDCHIVCQIHDALLCECRVDHVKDAVDLIKEYYTRPVAGTELRIPVDVEVNDFWNGGDKLFED